jgi:hypothetical protein
MSQPGGTSKQRSPVYAGASALLVILAGLWLLGAATSFMDAVQTRPGQLNTWLTLLPIGGLALGIYWIVQGLRRHRDPVR